MKKYIISILILVFLVAVDVRSLLLNFNNPCVYEACPDYGSGGEGLIKYVVDTTPPNFYIPAGTFCGIACTDYPAHINWSLFFFDFGVWILLSGVVFFVWKEKNIKYS